MLRIVPCDSRFLNPFRGATRHRHRCHVGKALTRRLAVTADVAAEFPSERKALRGRKPLRLSDIKRDIKRG